LQNETAAGLNLPPLGTQRMVDVIEPNGFMRAGP